MQNGNKGSAGENKHERPENGLVSLMQTFDIP